MTDSRLEQSDFDQPVSASEYVRSATEEYFGEAGTIEARDWTLAATGFITLVVLGAIILWQVL